MGQSQSTRSRTPSYRIDQTMGRSKNEDSGAFQPTQTKDASSLDESALDESSLDESSLEESSLEESSLTLDVFIFVNIAPVQFSLI